MSARDIATSQLASLNAVADQYPNNPAALWGALAGMGDRYAAAALAGLTGNQSLYGQVISNSNGLVGVTAAQNYQIEINTAENVALT